MNEPPSENALPVTLVFFHPWTDVATNGACCGMSVPINRLCSWWTCDERQPNRRFSHVELLMEGWSYGIRWGERVHADRRNYTNEDAYGFLTLYVEPTDHQRLQTWLNAAAQDKLRFNYVGNLINFLMPEPLLFALWGPYGDNEERAFCAEFVARAMQLIDALPNDLHPGVISPNRLWAELCERQITGELYHTRVVPSPHPSDATIV